MKLPDWLREVIRNVSVQAASLNQRQKQQLATSDEFQVSCDVKRNYLIGYVR